MNNNETEIETNTSKDIAETKVKAKTEIVEFEIDPNCTRGRGRPRKGDTGPRKSKRRGPKGAVPRGRPRGTEVQAEDVLSFRVKRDTWINLQMILSQTNEFETVSECLRDIVEEFVFQKLIELDKK